MAILAMMLICQAGFGQNMDKLFNEFSGKENVTRVTVGKVMMKLSSMFTETMGVEQIEVLAFEECSANVKENLETAIRNLKDPRFETMITANEEGSHTRIMIRIDQNIIRELVVLTSGNDSALIRIKGKIKPSDIEKVVKEHRNGC